MDDKPKRKVEDIDVKTWTSKQTMKVILAGIAYGLFMLIFFREKWYVGARDENGMALVAFLGVVPMVMGGMSTYLIPPQRRSSGNVLAVAIFSTVVFLAVTLTMFSGLFICVLMALPFVFGFVAVGWILVTVTRIIDKRLGYEAEKKKRYHAFAGFTLFLPLMIAPLEANMESPIWYRTVQDEIIINASPEAVWEHIIRMETINPDEQRPSVYHWLGIPRPIRATLDHDGIGGVRVGYFEHGLTFVEEIITWDVHEQVRFAVDVQHNDASTAVLKHIGGQYFDILEAGYQIEQLDSDHVILRLDSEYRLSTNFNGYGAFWSDWIMHDFQTYVLTTVKTRVEATS